MAVNISRWKGSAPCLDQHGWNYCVDICEIFGQCQTKVLKFRLEGVGDSSIHHKGHILYCQSPFTKYFIWQTRAIERK